MSIMDYLLMPTAHTLPPMYSADAVTARFQAEPAKFNNLMNLSMGIAYVAYLTSHYMAWRDKKSPFSLHQHCFYMAHDLLYTLSYPVFFEHYKDAVVWKNMWRGVVIFQFFELYGLAQAIKDERQFDWGCYFKGPVSVTSATICTIGEILLMHFILRFIIVSTHDSIFFNVFWWTNVGMAVGPFLKFAARRERVPLQLFFACLLVPVSAFTWAPPLLGMWTAADPWFNRWEFYMIGVLCIVVDLWHIALILATPKIDSVRTPQHKLVSGRKEL